MDGLLIDPAQKDENGSPAWLQLVLKVGVPAAIALYLVYTVAGSNTTLLANIDKAQHEHMVDSAVQTELLKDAKASSFRMEGYLRLVCVNTAKNDAERASCLSLR